MNYRYICSVTAFITVAHFSIKAQRFAGKIPASTTIADAGFRPFNNVKANGALTTINLPGTAAYIFQEGKKGWYERGLMREYDGAVDMRPWFGISFDVQLDTDPLVEIKLVLGIPKQPIRHDLPDSSTASIKVQGKGWHTITVPFSSFDYNRGQVYMLKFINKISITGSTNKPSNNTSIGLCNLQLVKGDPLYLNADIASKPVNAGGTVQYSVTVGNSSKTNQLVNLSFRNNGWEAMSANVEPAFVALGAGEEKQLTVSVTVPAIAPQGSQELQTLVAATPGGASAKIELITVSRLKGVYLVHTEPEWQAISSNIQKYDWAKKELEAYIKKANAFQVPEVPDGNLKTAEGTPAVFKSYLEQQFWPVAIVYKLTGEKAYAEKLAILLRRLSAKTAFPTTLHANSQGIPQEGGFWEAVARSYDLIRDANVLSADDKELIEQSLRLYIYTIEDGMGGGGISNWSVFNLCPAAQCALALQDLQHFNYLMDGPCGIKDHMRYGTMDDGWWYEVSLSYNIGCVENMTALGLAARPFGINFLTEKFPVSLSQKVGLRPFEFENFQGMAFGKFGPIKRNYVAVKDMWDAIKVYPDYRGIMFGMGDGHEHEVGGGAFELAYYAFRDTAYAAVIKRGSRRDLIYGVPQLPENTPLLYTQSAHSDNAGIAVLRSQTEGRDQSKQIQAAVKYGTHGSYHGHFDRASLLSVMRYGRSFWNPETSWFGYGSYMYKWWVQTSMASNMVVVDGKMQEPQETSPLLFHTGKMMQAMAVETNARWSNPPYFGGYEQIEKVTTGDAPFVPVPANHPKVTEVTDYTERVLQRRLMIVTDDYVVLADYLKGDKEHTFDNLLHLRGAKADPNLKLIGHDAQFDSSPLSSGQFITNVDNYAVVGVGKVLSTIKAVPGISWESGGFNGFQEPGILNIDAYNVWPQQTTLRIGNYAESYNGNKKLVYEVSGDGKALAKDSLGTWLLGRHDIDISVKGVKSLQLKTTKSKSGKNNTLFWGNARIITSKGKEIFLSQLKNLATNIVPTVAADKDYKGGPIAVSGIAYDHALAAEPSDASQEGIITIDLSRLDAVRFMAGIGGDSPVGDEGQVRKTVSFRSKGKEAAFLTVIEPYEDDQMVKSAKATDANTLMVLLKDGRTQKITIKNMDSKEGKVTIKLVEEKDGRLLRSEEAGL